MSDLLDAALGYARRGLPVFPCKPRGKRPITKHGVKDATVDVGQIRAWWTKDPDANIGVAVPASHVVVDIDDQGRAAKAAANLGEFPPTWAATTGGGGLHYWYRLPSGRRASNKVKLLRGIDIRTVGGYVIAPPSVHESGALYAWADEQDIATCPRWLVNKLDPREKKQPTKPPPAAPGAQRAAGSGYGRKALEGEAEKVRSAGEGCRNSTLNEAAFKVGQLVGGGELDEAEARRVLMHAAHECGLGERESVRAIGNGLEAGRQNPRRRAPRSDRERAPTAPIAQQGVDEAAPAMVEDWEKGLLWTKGKDGEFKLKACLHNGMLHMRHHESWRGKLSWDEFAQAVLVEGRLPRATGRDTGPWPREWTDDDDIYTSSWLESVPKIRLAPERCGQVARAIAKSNTRHPVKEYLAGLTWDGTPRLNAWLEVYLGAPESEYSAMVGTWWMIAAIARIMRPGCKVDNLLILEGPQGLQKSTALKVLAGEDWFTDTNFEIGSKDAFLAIRGHWIVEMAELDSLGRAAASRAKAFLSSSVDNYRPPYARNPVRIPRQCVFAGTVNPEDHDGGGYLKDATGNRRYWPVRCRRVSLDALSKDRDQLWAEARDRFAAGERWYPATAREKAICAGEQAERQEQDAWEDIVARWLAGVGRLAISKEEVTTTRILLEALQFPKERINRIAQIRVGKVMTGLGYGTKKVTLGGRRVRVYVPGAVDV